HEAHTPKPMAGCQGTGIAGPGRQAVKPTPIHAPLLALLSPQQSNLSRHRTWGLRSFMPYACCPCQPGYENHAFTFATRHTPNRKDGRLGHRAIPWSHEQRTKASSIGVSNIQKRIFSLTMGFMRSLPIG